MSNVADPRIAAFEQYAKEADLLRHKFDHAYDNLIQAEEAARILASSKDPEEIRRMHAFLSKLGSLAVLRCRHAAAKLRLQLHITNGRPIRQAALDAAEVSVLDAVGGEMGLTTSPSGPLARVHLAELRRMGAWPSGTSPRDVSLHIGEVWMVIQAAREALTHRNSTGV